MLYKDCVEHPRWGRIVIMCNPRARRIIMRARPDSIHVTVPPGATSSDIERALDKCGEELLHRRQQNRCAIIDKDFSINTLHFSLSVRENAMKGVRITGKDGAYILYCQEGTEYSCDSIQQKLRQCVKAAMKHCANAVLLPRLEELALQHGFRYSSCTIRDVHTRWGSCTSRGSISLNMHLIVLPDRLIDYVLLHELCHTVEMNHGENFWKLMDRCTNPVPAKSLRAELKNKKFIV